MASKAERALEAYKVLEDLEFTLLNDWTMATITQEGKLKIENRLLKPHDAIALAHWILDMFEDKEIKS
jgi:tRNA C32,U32 (ribose-2'-O)-methylase TrmJ